MALDRDELAARLAVADFANPISLEDGGLDAAEWADRIVESVDALLARLRPEAVAPAASRPEEPVKGDSTRSEWVRITGPANAVKVTVGKAYRVVGWHDEHGGGPIIECDGIKEPWHLYPHDKADSVFPSWEPCSAPSPAAIVGECGTVSTLPAERAAAGLPVDESAFDEAKEREAAKVAVSRDAGDDFTRGWLARARVAAKGGAK